MKRYHFKGTDGAVRLRLLHGPTLDDVRLTRQVNDDQVVELELDAAELRGLHHVLGAILKVRDQAKAPPARPAPAAGAAALAIAAVVLAAALGVVGCLTEGTAAAGPFDVTYADRPPAAPPAIPRCPLPTPERVALAPERPECAYVAHRDGRGLNLLCEVPWRHVHLDVRWDPRGESGRGVMALEQDHCSGDYGVAWQRAREAD